MAHASCHELIVCVYLRCRRHTRNANIKCNKQIEKQCENTGIDRHTGTQTSTQTLQTDTQTHRPAQTPHYH